MLAEMREREDLREVHPPAYETSSPLSPVVGGSGGFGGGEKR